MIECKELTLSYGKKIILDSISFQAQPGQITIILGKNGSGKSTLFRAISGNKSYSGHLLLDGEEVSKISRQTSARHLAMMPQFMPGPSITVRELVSFGRQPYTGTVGILSSKDKEIVEQVLAKTDLMPLADKLVSHISGGERQKAYFALMLAQDTPNLILDEPSAHLDAAYDHRLAGFLKEAAAEGRTVLGVFHDINRALDLADRILVIHEHHLVFQGTSEDFTFSGLAENIFGLKAYHCVDEHNRSRILYQ